MHPRIPLDGNSPSRHPAADPFHLGGIPANFELVACLTAVRLAFDSEKIIHAKLPLAEKNRQRADRRIIQPAGVIGRRESPASSGTGG